MVKEDQRLAFVKKTYPYAKQVEQETGFPSLAILAQAAGESGWREPKGNMYFGIKATSDEQRQLIRTKEYHNTPDVKYPVIHSVRKSGDKYLYDVEDWFRAYDSPYESFMDHAQFIVENPRYKKALDKKDPKEFLSELAKAGYATSPHYERFMHNMVDSVNRRLKKLSLI